MAGAQDEEEGLGQALFEVELIFWKHMRQLIKLCPQVVLLQQMIDDKDIDVNCAILVEKNLNVGSHST